LGSGGLLAPVIVPKYTLGGRGGGGGGGAGARSSFTAPRR